MKTDEEEETELIADVRPMPPPVPPNFYESLKPGDVVDCLDIKGIGWWKIRIDNVHRPEETGTSAMLSYKLDAIKGKATYSRRGSNARAPVAMSFLAYGVSHFSRAIV